MKTGNDHGRRRGRRAWVMMAWLLTASMAGASSWAGTSSPSPSPSSAEAAFHITRPWPLEVTWQGRPIITGESLNAAAQAVWQQADGQTSQTLPDGWQVHNRWRVREGREQATYRREVATNGRALELTVQFRTPPFYVSPQGTGHTYAFHVPADFLDGAQAHAWTGRLVGKNRMKLAEFALSAAMPDGEVVPKAYDSVVSYLALTWPDGRRLVLDGNPMGATTFGETGTASSLQGMWRLRKDGARFSFYFGVPATTHNGVYSIKMQMFEGSIDDYAKRRSWHGYSYYDQLPAFVQAGFGQGTPAKGWQAVALSRFDATRGHGWRDTPQATLRGDVTQGMLHGLAQGHGPATYRVRVPQPGLYVVTLRTALADSAEPAGPFDVSANEVSTAQAVVAPPGKVTTLTFVRYVEGDTLDIQWQGDWAVSTLAVQKLLYAAEDFSFKRAVWLAADVPSPTKLLDLTPAMPPTAAVVDRIDWVRDLPAADVLANAKLPPARVLSSDPADPAIDWRWWGGISSLGPGNYSSFHEFADEAQAARRLDMLKAQGTRIILLNGMHFRHAWPDHRLRIRDTIALIARLGHERGMKVLDHHDLTVLPHQNLAYNALLDGLDHTLRHVANGQVTRGFCINNPDYRQAFWDHLLDWVKVTDIDGLMLDEVTFHTAEFCGCQHCRAKFHRDTGVSLPVDESSPALMNNNHRLWKLWLSWRNRASGDFYVEMLERVRAVRPDFVLMKYTTPYGLVSDYVTKGQGGGLEEGARSASFLGSEVMSRNVYATYRSNLAYLSIYNSMGRSYRIPMFSLVYPNGQPVFAYAGWAMNNMRGHATWSIEMGNPAIEADARRYFNWPDNMAVRHSDTVADVAVLFSSQSKDFPRYMNHFHDLVGVCELLDDLHVPHDVLMDRDLEPARAAHALAKYRLLILPASCAMTDGQIAGVEAFLRQGGQVLAIGHAGLLDELGVERKAWPIGRWIGLSWNWRFFNGQATLQGNVVGDSPLAYDDSHMQVNDAGQAKVLATIRQGDQERVSIAQGQVGRGTLTVALPRIGRMNYEQERTLNQPFEFAYNEPALALFGRLVAGALADRPFEAVQIPRAVRVTVWRQRLEVGHTTYVHLLNMTAARPAKGQPVPGQPPREPFPALDGDVVFEVVLPLAAQGRGVIVSPDWPGHRPVTMRSLGAGRWRVTVAKADLHAYAMVRLD